MIQKRYQFQGKSGKEWSDWYNYTEDDPQFSRLKTEEKYQLKSRLLNEFRIV